jgi:hypothetical protein
MLPEFGRRASPVCEGKPYWPAFGFGTQARYSTFGVREGGVATFADFLRCKVERFG